MALRDPRPSGKMTEDAAQSLAIVALAYLSQTPDLMQRFLALTGIEASQIREAAREPHFFAGVLKFFAAHEPTLSHFAKRPAHRRNLSKRPSPPCQEAVIFHSKRLQTIETTQLIRQIASKGVPLSLSQAF